MNPGHTLYSGVIEAVCSLSSDAGGGEGRGEELRFVGVPLSSILSPLVPHGERKKNETVLDFMRLPDAHARFNVGRKRGALRARAACSKACAMPINFGSLQARPKNDRPTGSPLTSPHGTVMFGKPDAAA